VVTHYDLRAISTRPGVVYISPHFTTVIEFSELMDEISTSRPSLFQIKVSESENILFLKALKEAGSADLVVRVRGYIALFKVVVDPKMDAPRRYVVTLPTRSEVPATSLPSPSASIEVPRPANPSTPPAPSSGGQGAGGAERAAAPSPLPPWLKAEFSPVRMGSGWFVQYRVVNGGTEPVTLRAADLVVLRNGVSVPFRLVRTSFGSSIEAVGPKEEATGVIVVEDSPEPISWIWTVRAQGTSYTLQGKAE